MKINKFFAGLLLASSLLFASPILAGGQMASLYADTAALGAIDGYYGRVIRVYINPGYPCKGSEVTFKFVEPKDGDMINTSGTGQTFVFQEDIIDGVNCSTYAKYFSKVYGEREVTVEIKNNGSLMVSPPVIKVGFDGQYHTDNEYNGYSYRSSTDSPYPAWLYNPKPDVAPVCTSSSIAPQTGSAPLTVSLHGSGTGFGSNGITGYVWDFENDGKWDTDLSLDPVNHTYTNQGVYQPKYKIKGGNGIWSQTCNYPYKIIVNSTNNPTPPPANINAWLLDQKFLGQNRREVSVKWGAFGGFPGTFTIYAKENNNGHEESFDGSKGPSVTFNIKANQDYQIRVHGCMDKFGTCVDSNIINLPGAKNDIANGEFHPKNEVVYQEIPADNELKQKVASLESQLNESKKQQGLLEQRINSLINFLKNLFPFFK